MNINVSSEFNTKDEESIKRKGQVFTPRYICEDIINRLDIKISDIVCEPSVGKGIFVFTLLEKFRENNTNEEIIDFVENRLFTFEIDENINNEFKKLLAEYLLEMFGCKSLNLRHISNSDFLLNDDNYDVIIGNPPYIRIQNMDDDYVSLIREKYYTMSGNSDIYYAFIEKSISSSNRFGFITPNSFIKNKSATKLRNILLPRLSYLKDNGHDKVWSDISTYTSIIICGDITNTFEWVSPSGYRSVIKSDLNDKWYTEKVGGTSLSEMLYSMHGGIATLKDSSFIAGDNIEDEICKKLVKATKNETKRIIYPYIDGKVIDEEILKHKYPNCYSHLLSEKEILLKRDRGNQLKYPTWYSYGRSQGFLREVKGIPVVISKAFRKSLGPDVIDIDDETLIVSGMFCDIKPEFYDEFIKVIRSDEFIKFCELRNNKMSDTKGSEDVFLTLSGSTIKEFTY
jgi:adenine-specific DNA-methyltransferase